MRNILFGLFIFFVTSVFAGSLKNLDSKYGFRELKFGDRPDKILLDLSFISKDSSFTVYKRKISDLHIGRAPISELRYMFFEDHFAAVGISTIGVDNSNALLEATYATYGYPRKELDYISFNSNPNFNVDDLLGTTINWETNKVLMRYFYTPIGEQGILTIWAKKYIEEWEQRKQDRARESWKDF